MRQLLYKISLLSIILVFFSLLLIIYWELYPYKILEFKEGNGEILTPVVKSDEYLQMRQINCKYIKLKGSINRQFIDSLVYYAPEIHSNREVGCQDTVEYIYIPKAIPPGTYYIISTITYHPNPIREINYQIKTATFEVK